MGLRETLMELEAQEVLKELVNAVNALTKRVELLDIFLGPKREDLMFERPFQFATVPSGTTREVYRQDIRRGYVGVITHIANDWFASTTLSRYVDSVSSEEPIRRSIAPLDQPLAVKLFATREIVWTATNNDTVSRTFGVLTNGYFIPEDVYDRAIGVEG